MLVEVVDEEVDLVGQAARLFQHVSEFRREFFRDGLAEFLPAPKVLVGRTAIQPRTLGNFDDGQAVWATLGKELAGGRNQGRARSLGVAPQRPLSGAREEVPLRLVPRRPWATP